MKKIHAVKSGALALALMVPLAAVPALAATALPRPVHSGNVTYITGGIGSEEREALQRVKTHYNLNVLSAGRYGEYVSDVTVRIRDQRGMEVVNTNAGPLLFVNLPPGIYTVEAAVEGQTRSQRVRVPEYGGTNVDFRWNAL